MNTCSDSEAKSQGCLLEIRRRESNFVGGRALASLHLLAWPTAGVGRTQSQLAVEFT